MMRTQLSRLFSILIILVAHHCHGLPTLAAVTTKCAELNSNVNYTTAIYDGSCYIVHQLYVEVTLASSIAVCNTMNDDWSALNVKPHLSWSWTLDQVTAVASVYPDNLAKWPHVGMYRLQDSTISDYEGWYFVGSSINQLFGPLPNLQESFPVFNNGDGISVGVGDASVMYSVRINSIMELRNTFVAHGLIQHVICQVESNANYINNVLRISLECLALNTTVAGVNIWPSAQSTVQCVHACVQLGAFCTAASFDANSEVCVHGLLVEDRADHAACSLSDKAIVLEVNSSKCYPANECVHSQARCCFAELSLLFRWKGSIWKSIWKELIIYLLMFYAIRGLYQHGLSDETKFNSETNETELSQKETFAKLARLVDDNTNTKQIPLTFLLGFYVALIVGRWWKQFQLVNWPDDLLSYTCMVWDSESLHDVHVRCTIARYINLTCALCWRDISVRVRRRFPTIEHVHRCGLIADHEMEIYNQTRTEAVRWQLPLTWIQRLLEKRMKDKEAPSLPPPLYVAFMGELKSMRTAFRELYCFDWICVPLVYTQVAAIATYGYFAFCLIGRQTVDGDVDLYFPIFTVLQYLFYVGWFKVGQDLIRPFGTDDDNIELNYILDRNVQASFALVRNVMSTIPHAVTDPEDSNANILMAMSDRTAGKTFPEHVPVTFGKTVTVLPHTRLSATQHDHPPKLHANVSLSNTADAEEAQMDNNEELPPSVQIRSRLPQCMQRVVEPMHRPVKEKRHRHF